MEQMLVQLMPLFLIFAIFYFLLIRPQQRRAKEHKEMVAGVQRGDKIVSSGGIRGKVVKVVGDFDVEVEISQGVNVTLVKSTIAEVVNGIGQTLETKSQVPIRIAVTGKRVGLPLFKPMEILGRQSVLTRLRDARANLT